VWGLGAEVAPVAITPSPFWASSMNPVGGINGFLRDFTLDTVDNTNDALIRTHEMALDDMLSTNTIRNTGTAEYGSVTNLSAADVANFDLANDTWSGVELTLAAVQDQFYSIWGLSMQAL